LTATDTSHAPPTARPTAPAATALTTVAAAAGGITLLLRLALAGGSFDLFGDEVIYTDLGHSVASGGFPRIDGQLFFLHPPGFFYLEAGWEWLLGHQPGMIAGVYQMRMLNALLAAATAVVLVLLVARAGSLRAAAAAGLVFAVDPFCIRQNDRVLLETAMMLWVLLGYLALVSLIGRLPSRQAYARAVGAGLLFGCAVLTKDEAALLTVLPLIAAVALRWGPSRSLALVTAATTVAAYAAYVIAVAAAGEFSALWLAKTTGVRRLLGLVQTTGFNRPRAPSLSTRLISEVGSFGVTYVILAMSVPALVLVLRRGGAPQRVLGMLHVAAALALGYGLILGTLEEQELYILLVPSLLTLAVGAALWRVRAGERWGMPKTVAIITAVIVALSLSFTTCLRWLLTPDDGYAQLRLYMAAHVPAGAAVTGVDGTTERGVTAWVLGDRYRIGRWVTPAARSQERVRYVVVPWEEVDQDYSYLTRAQVRDLIEHGRLVFSYRGRTYGDLALYQLALTPGTGHAP